MKYKLLQQRIKQYKKAGYTNIHLNSKKQVLKLEYNRLLQLELSQKQLEQAITNFEADRIDAIDPIAVSISSESYPLRLIKSKIFQLAKVKNLKELKQNYPIIKEKKFDFRYKSAWVDCLQLIAEITNNSRENEKFFQAVKRAIEIEIKSGDNEFYRHETPDSDLYTLLSDHNLFSSTLKKNHSVSNSLKHAYILDKCHQAGLDPQMYSLI